MLNNFVTYKRDYNGMFIRESVTNPCQDRFQTKSHSFKRDIFHGMRGKKEVTCRTAKARVSHSEMGLI